MAAGRSPFRTILKRLWVTGFWIFALGGIAFAIYKAVEHHRLKAREARHTWAHMKDDDARVIASDALVAALGQEKATKASLTRMRRTTIAGGRAEWELRYRVADGLHIPVCVYVWKEKDDYGDWVPKNDVVSVCE